MVVILYQYQSMNVSISEAMNQIHACNDDFRSYAESNHSALVTYWSSPMTEEDAWGWSVEISIDKSR